MDNSALKLLVLTVLSLLATARSADKPPPAQTTAEVVSRATQKDWRRLEPENTIYMELPAGRVVIELAPAFAPKHVANVKALIREKYFDGLAIVRAQDNYVVQWGDPDAEKPDLARKITVGKKTLPAEFDHRLDRGLPFAPLPDGDVYAPEVGFSSGFPMARDVKSGRMWLTHVYGMVGAGRDNAPDSGGGTELYVVIGHAPRHLDRNVTLLGRVIQGMELLSTLQRGPAPMGFYEKPEMRTPINSIRIAADVPENERSQIEILRTDTPLFRDYINARRQRNEDWFYHHPGRIEIGNLAIPTRPVSTQP